MGMYGHIIGYLKQVLFQGKDITSNPWMYARNAKFVLSSTLLLGVGVGVWFCDGLIRQKLKMSEVLGWSSVISAPISAITALFVLRLSEKHLSDKISWEWAILWAVGIMISMIAGTFMMKR